MDKYIYYTKNGLWYELQGGYHLPCLKLPKEESRHIGVWAQKMNNILNAAMEIVSSDLICA